MADIPGSNWSETDSSNTDAAPDGAPEGMAPAGVNNVLRAHQGAIKRFWNKINAVKTTAGTSTAYTLSYDVAPAAYVDGEIISFVVNAANGAAATINVNALGAKALRLFGGNLLAGALLADQVVQARYNSSAGAFDIIPQNGWVRIGEVDASAASTVDFTSIPAGVKHLMLVGECTVAMAAGAMNVRTYGADGVLDSGASDYSYIQIQGFGGTVAAVTSTTSSMSLTGAVDTGTDGASFDCTAVNIQASTRTKFNFRSQYVGSGSYSTISGSGERLEADRITGVRIFNGAGNVTGKFTLFGSA